MENPPQTQLTVVWNDARELFHLTDFLENLWKEWKLVPDLFPSVNQAVDTLFLAIVSHAFDDEETHMIGIRAKLEGDELTIVLKDGGRPFNPLLLANKSTDRSAAVFPADSPDLSIIRQTMDQVSYERKNDKNLLTMVKRLQTRDDG